MHLIRQKQAEEKHVTTEITVQMVMNHEGAQPMTRDLQCVRK